MHPFVSPSFSLPDADGAVPVGAIVTFLFVALRAAIDVARQRPAESGPRAIWRVWLLGPATVLCLLAALFAIKLAS